MNEALHDPNCVVRRLEPGRHRQQQWPQLIAQHDDAFQEAFQQLACFYETVLVGYLLWHLQGELKPVGHRITPTLEQRRRWDSSEGVCYLDRRKIGRVIAQHLDLCGIVGVA